MAATARHTADISFRRLGSERLDHVPIHHRPNLTTFRSFGRYLRAPPNARPILSAFAISEAPSPCAFIARTWAASIEAGRPLYTPAALAWRSPRAGARGRPSLSFQSHTAAPVSRRWPGGRVGRAAWRAPTRRQPTRLSTVIAEPQAAGTTTLRGIAAEFNNRACGNPHRLASYWRGCRSRGHYLCRGC
jgi:hypothetical protein